MIQFFQTLVDEIYNPEDPLHKACAWYCFQPLIKNNLEEFMEHWNSHYIRNSNFSEVNGRPNSLYVFPKHGKTDQKIPVDNNDLLEMEWYVNNSLDEDIEFDCYFEYFDYVVSELNLRRELTWNGARNLFLTLLEYGLQE